MMDQASFPQAKTVCTEMKFLVSKTKCFCCFHFIITYSSNAYLWKDNYRLPVVRVHGL
jgi:hypothetical protein